MKRLPTVLLALLTILFCVTAQAQTDAYQKKWFVAGTDSLPYRILLPKDYSPKKKYPLILVLHGAGERGSNNESQLVHGSKLFLRDSTRERYPAIVVFPQCPATSYWSNVQIKYDSAVRKRVFAFQTEGEPTKAMSLLLQLLNNLEDQYKLDKKQRYAGGLSMGGMGTFEVVRRKPKYFAAAFPICGGANTETASELKKTPWWIFHGLKDDVVPPSLSENMAAALKAQGANVKLTLYPNANHNSWDPAFAESMLMAWLFSNRK